MENKDKLDIEITINDVMSHGLLPVTKSELARFHERGLRLVSGDLIFISESDFDGLEKMGIDNPERFFRVDTCCFWGNTIMYDLIDQAP